MATPKIIADFETQLATALSVGGTSFTLASATDDDGNSLPAGLYYFTVENGTSNKEYLAGTLSGTSVTSVVNVSRQGTETSGAVRAHRVGSSVIITDFATYKKYMDEIALVSAPDGDTSTKGVFEGATLAEVRARTATGGTGAALAVTPDVLDDLPTEGEKDALAGGSTFGTPSSSNKFITQDYNASATGLPVVRTYLTAGSPATWTKPAGLKYIIVEVQAAGGNGGAGQDEGNGGGGGGGGGYARKLIAAASLGSTETVTTGAAGASSSFGSFLSATAGSDGQPGSGTSEGGDGGIGSGGDLNIKGGGGGTGNTGDSATRKTGGIGGSSQLGGGGRQRYPLNGSTTGIAGGQYGGGGSGGTDQGGGGAGAAGIVIVTEYYS